MKNYYVLSNGRVKREHNTVYIETAEGEKKPLPVEDIDSLYLFGEIDLNTRLLNFLSQKHITLHVFNYYGFYAGSFYPREYLNSGFLTVQQVAHYSDDQKRLAVAREFVRGAAHSLVRNIAYYERRRTGDEDACDPPGEIGAEAISQPAGIPQDPELEAEIDSALDDSSCQEHTPPLPSPQAGRELEGLAAIRSVIEGLAAAIGAEADVNVLRGIEGKVRERYYQAWGQIVSGEWAFDRRVRRPPDNEINALISFGNSLLYTVCLSEIYRTQLTPTLSYLHEPGVRRFSLALDLSEIFKPLIVDRAIFRLLNTGQLKESHFDKDLNGCFMNDAGKRIFLAALEARLGSTIRHRRLGRHVSYRHLIRLECYKLIRHLTGVETYRAFRAWW